MDSFQILITSTLFIWVLILLMRLRKSGDIMRAIDGRLNMIIANEKKTDIVGNLSADLLRHSMHSSRTATIVSLIASTLSLVSVLYAYIVPAAFQIAAHRDIALQAGTLTSFLTAVFIAQATLARRSVEKQFDNIQRNSREQVHNEQIAAMMQTLYNSKDPSDRQAYRELVNKIAMSKSVSLHVDARVEDAEA
jgi:hypothetical protein